MDTIAIQLSALLQSPFWASAYSTVLDTLKTSHPFLLGICIIFILYVTFTIFVEVSKSQLDTLDETDEEEEEEEEKEQEKDSSEYKNNEHKEETEPNLKESLPEPEYSATDTKDFSEAPQPNLPHETPLEQITQAPVAPETPSPLTTESHVEIQPKAISVKQEEAEPIPSQETLILQAIPPHVTQRVVQKHIPSPPIKKEKEVTFFKSNPMFEELPVMQVKSDQIKSPSKGIKSPIKENVNENRKKTVAQRKGEWDHITEPKKKKISPKKSLLSRIVGATVTIPVKPEVIQEIKPIEPVPQLIPESIPNEIEEVTFEGCMDQLNTFEKSLSKHSKQVGFLWMVYRKSTIQPTSIEQVHSLIHGFVKYLGIFKLEVDFRCMLDCPHLFLRMESQYAALSALTMELCVESIGAGVGKGLKNGVSMFDK